MSIVTLNLLLGVKKAFFSGFFNLFFSAIVSGGLGLPSGWVEVVGRGLPTKEYQWIFYQSYWTLDSPQSKKTHILNLNGYICVNCTTKQY